MSMKNYFYLLLMMVVLSPLCSYSCEEKEWVNAAGAEIKKRAPEGSIIGITPSGKEFKYTVERVLSDETFTENGVISVGPDSAGKCKVTYKQSQSQTSRGPRLNLKK